MRRPDGPARRAEPDIRRRFSGAFEGWRIDGQPRDIATSTWPTGAYFSEANQAAIGRISNKLPLAAVTKPSTDSGQDQLARF